MNEPNTSQQFDPFYAFPECNVPNVPMAIPAQDGAVHLPPLGMEDIQYNEEFKHEDICVSLDPDALETILQSINQCLGQGQDLLFNPEFSFSDNMDTRSNLDIGQPMMNMASINDAHFSQMVSGNQMYPSDLENIEGLLCPVKSENELDHWMHTWTIVTVGTWVIQTLLDYKHEVEQEKMTCSVVVCILVMQIVF